MMHQPGSAGNPLLAHLEDSITTIGQQFVSMEVMPESTHKVAKVFAAALACMIFAAVLISASLVLAHVITLPFSMPFAALIVVIVISSLSCGAFVSYIAYKRNKIIEQPSTPTTQPQIPPATKVDVPNSASPSTVIPAQPTTPTVPGEPSPVPSTEDSGESQTPTVSTIKTAEEIEKELKQQADLQAQAEQQAAHEAELKAQADEAEKRAKVLLNFIHSNLLTFSKFESMDVAKLEEYIKEASSLVVLGTPEKNTLDQHQQQYSLLKQAVALQQQFQTALSSCATDQLADIKTKIAELLPQINPEYATAVKDIKAKIELCSGHLNVINDWLIETQKGMKNLATALEGELDTLFAEMDKLLNRSQALFTSDLAIHECLQTAFGPKIDGVPLQLLQIASDAIDAIDASKNLEQFQQSIAKAEKLLQYANSHQKLEENKKRIEELQGICQQKRGWVIEAQQLIPNSEDDIQTILTATTISMALGKKEKLALDQKEIIKLQYASPLMKNLFGEKLAELRQQISNIDLDLHNLSKWNERLEGFVKELSLDALFLNPRSRIECQSEYLRLQKELQNLESEKEVITWELPLFKNLLEEACAKAKKSIDAQIPLEKLGQLDAAFAEPILKAMLEIIGKPDAAPIEMACRVGIVKALLTRLERYFKLRVGDNAYVIKKADLIHFHTFIAVHERHCAITSDDRKIIAQRGSKSEYGNAFSVMGVVVTSGRKLPVLSALAHALASHFLDQGTLKRMESIRDKSMDVAADSKAKGALSWKIEKKGHEAGTSIRDLLSFIAVQYNQHYQDLMVIKDENPSLETLLDVFFDQFAHEELMRTIHQLTALPSKIEVSLSHKSMIAALGEVLSNEDVYLADLAQLMRIIDTALPAQEKWTTSTNPVLVALKNRLNNLASFREFEKILGEVRNIVQLGQEIKREFYKVICGKDLPMDQEFPSPEEITSMLTGRTLDLRALAGLFVTHKFVAYVKLLANFTCKYIARTQLLQTCSEFLTDESVGCLKEFQAQLKSTSAITMASRSKKKGAQAAVANSLFTDKGTLLLGRFVAIIQRCSRWPMPFQPFKNIESVVSFPARMGNLLAADMNAKLLLLSQPDYAVYVKAQQSCKTAYLLLNINKEAQQLSSQQIQDIDSSLNAVQIVLNSFDPQDDQKNSAKLNELNEQLCKLLENIPVGLQEMLARINEVPMVHALV